MEGRDWGQDKKQKAQDHRFPSLSKVKTTLKYLQMSHLF
jgi:hypothetical protein